MQIPNYQHRNLEFGAARGGGRGGYGGKSIHPTTSNTTPPTSNSADRTVTENSGLGGGRGGAAGKRTHSENVARGKKSFRERHPRITKAFSFLTSK